MNSASAILTTVLTVGTALATAPSGSSALQASLSYCDNLFYLSPSDIDSFLLSRNPLRLPYRSLDDISLTTAWSTVWRFSRAGYIRARLTTHCYFVNWEKSYSVARLEAGRRLFKTLTAELAGLWMPNRLIRHYLPTDPSRKRGYAECRFSEYLLAVEFRQRYSRFRATSDYGFEIDDYLQQFDAYDSRIHRLGLELTWLPWQHITLSLGYRYRLSSARGRVPDISYYQHGLEIGAAADLPKPAGLRLHGAGFSEWRAYTTANRPEVDPAHSGRKDDTRKLILEVTYPVNRVTLTAAWNHEWQETHSPYSTVIDEIKDYSVSTVRLGITLPLGRTR